MYAIVEIAGFQEKVSKGDKLKVPLLKEEPEGAVKFENVLMLADGDKVQVGLPFLSGVSIEAKVLSHGRGKKIRIQKAHRRKRYRRVAGHRQDFTEIEITKIAA